MKIYISSLPSLTFVPGAEDFQPSGRNYVLRLRRGQCLAGIHAGSNRDEGEWILGGVFLQKFYSEFDVAQSSIGLAESRQSP